MVDKENAEKGTSAHHEVTEAKPGRPIPARSAEATPGMVDLSDYYNTSLDDRVHAKPGNDLSSLPKGVQEFGGTPFDVRGLIQLAGSRSVEITGVIYPEAVRGIKVYRKGQHVHFFHSAAWHAEAGTVIGEYAIHYADGQTKTIPIVYQQNVIDWWEGPDAEPPSAAEVVWEGGNDRTLGMGLSIQLCKYTWQNPLPDVEIETIDLVSASVESAPFLIAITVV